MKNFGKALKSAWRQMGGAHPASGYWPATSVIFDERWYLQSYDDLVGVDARKHYWEWGQKEGRRPSLYFDPAWYGIHRPDVPVSMQLKHYCEHGWREGSSPSPFFDPDYYLRTNPDVAAADCEPLQHYLEFGWREGRNPHPAINVRALLDSVGDSGEEPVGKLFRMHFSPGAHPLLGWAALGVGAIPPSAEVRDIGATEGAPTVAISSQPETIEDDLSLAWISGETSPWFDERWYLSQYPDVLQSGQTAFDHYRTVGWKENKWPNALFEPAAYQRINSDLTEDTEPLSHYVTTGRFEGRTPSSLFHTEWFAREWQIAHGEAIEPRQAFALYLSHPQAGNISTHPLFDPIWYRMEKGAASVERPLEEYLHNREQFISPHPLVDEQWYHDVFMQEDRRAALKQYLEYGHAWGWTPHPLFDESFYKANTQCDIPGAMHYLLYGESQGIRPNAHFSPFYYKATYHHLDDAERSPLTHFARIGDAQGLSPSAEFNAKLYRSRYLSFSEEWRAMRHFMTKGRYEGINIEALAHPLSIRQWLQMRKAEPSLLSSTNTNQIRVTIIVRSSPRTPLAALLKQELRSSNACVVTSILHIEENEDIRAHIEATDNAADAYLLINGNAVLAQRDFEILITELVSGQTDAVVPMVVGMDGIVIANNDTLQKAILRPLDWRHPHVNARRKEVKAAGPVMLVAASALAAHYKTEQSASAFPDLIEQLGKTSVYAPLSLALGMDSQPWVCTSSTNMVGKRLLYIDSTIPRPDQDAGSDTAFRVLKMLKEEGWEITFLPDANYQHDGRYTEALQNLGIFPYYLPYIRYSADFIENCDQDFDAIFLARVYSGGAHLDAAKKRWPKARIVFNTVDLHYLREQREAILKNDAEGFAHSIELKKREFDLIRKADATIVVSSTERDILEKEGVKGNIFVVHPAFEAGCYVPYIPENRKNIFFLGGYAHLPNVDAVDFFVEEVWPLVLKQRHDIVFCIAGANPPEHFKDYVSDTIRLVGYVENLDNFLSDMRINIAPLRYGAGVKVKVVAGLASGIPCIATSIAVEGTGIHDGHGIVVANDPIEIATAIIDLYDDTERLAALSKNGRKVVQDNYSMDSVKNIYKKMLSP